MDPRAPSFSRKIPQGDERERAVCDACGFVDYVNPKIVAGAVVAAADGRILMCKRAIEPRRGFWTLPAGYMEEGESVEAGAAREAREEACCEIAIDALIGVYSIPRISQVQLFFRASLASDIAAGPESEAVALYEWERIPRAEIAFPSVVWALEDWRATKDETCFAPARRSAQ
ncbi:MAG: NUDIX domain-containing protein [Maricaulaceae bacterium]